MPLENELRPFDLNVNPNAEFILNNRIAPVYRPVVGNYRIQPPVWEDVVIRDDVLDDDEAFRQRLNKVLKEKPEKMDKRTVGGYLGVNTKGTFGIEIEVEGVNLLKAIAGKWTDKADGSLRGESREYILRKPLNLDAAKVALQDLSKALAAHQSILQFSFRTSVHVHVNVLDMDKVQLHTFLYLAHLFENALVEYSGTERTGNRFCLRCTDAEYKIAAMCDFLSGGRFIGLKEDALKYSAINLCPIMTQGSVEFRSMRGTLDPVILFPWLDVLQNIRDLSQGSSVKELANRAVSNPKQLIKDVFGKHLPLFEYSGLEKDLRHSYSMLIEMPHLKVGT